MSHRDEYIYKLSVKLHICQANSRHRLIVNYRSVRKPSGEKSWRRKFQAISTEERGNRIIGR